MKTPLMRGVAIGAVIGVIVFGYLYARNNQAFESAQPQGVETESNQPSIQTQPEIMNITGHMKSINENEFTVETNEEEKTRYVIQVNDATKFLMSVVKTEAEIQQEISERNGIEAGMYYTTEKELQYSDLEKDQLVVIDAESENNIIRALIVYLGTDQPIPYLSQPPVQ